jgi:hypothetical protein
VIFIPTDCTKAKPKIINLRKGESIEPPTSLSTTGRGRFVRAQFVRSTIRTQHNSYAAQFVRGTIRTQNKRGHNSTSFNNNKNLKHTFCRAQKVGSGTWGSEQRLPWIKMGLWPCLFCVRIVLRTNCSAYELCAYESSPSRDRQCTQKPHLTL